MYQLEDKAWDVQAKAYDAINPQAHGNQGLVNLLRKRRPDEVDDEMDSPSKGRAKVCFSLDEGDESQGEDDREANVAEDDDEALEGDVLTPEEDAAFGQPGSFLIGDVDVVQGFPNVSRRVCRPLLVSPCCFEFP
ncbi:hypothetical protein HDU86_002978 [Geranomyces michiganensis]|nr:hypothetical protein HDU86_002978 [Geranomyces michiganensis]